MSKAFIALIILCTVTVSAQDSTNRFMQLAVAGQAVDLTMTKIALANGYSELNPFMANQSVRIVSKVAVSILFYIYSKKYPEDKKAMILVAVLSWLPVGHNFAVTIKQEGW